METINQQKDDFCKTSSNDQIQTHNETLQRKMHGDHGKTTKTKFRKLADLFMVWVPKNINEDSSEAPCLVFPNSNISKESFPWMIMSLSLRNHFKSKNHRADQRNWILQGLHSDLVTVSQLEQSPEEPAAEDLLKNYKLLLSQTTNISGGQQEATYIVIDQEKIISSLKKSKFLHQDSELTGMQSKNDERWAALDTLTMLLKDDNKHVWLRKDLPRNRQMIIYIEQVNKLKVDIKGGISDHQDLLTISFSTSQAAGKHRVSHDKKKRELASSGSMTVTDKTGRRTYQFLSNHERSCLQMKTAEGPSNSSITILQEEVKEIDIFKGKTMLQTLSAYIWEVSTEFKDPLPSWPV